MNTVVWMPHPAHFIGAFRCQFRMATGVKVGRQWVVVSTVGEYRPASAADDSEPEQIGSQRTYETYVWRGRMNNEKGRECCPIEADVSKGSLEMRPANTPRDAAYNHRFLVASLTRAKSIRGWLR